MSLSIEKATLERPYPVTPESEGAAVVRDPRGWLYRLFAPDPQCAVLQVGDGFAENWLPNVMGLDLRKQTIASFSAASFDLVVMHYSLGGLQTLDAAVASASRVLRRGGVLAIAGENRLRRATESSIVEGQSRPRSSAWGYRRAMVENGFGDVRLFVVSPPGNAPVYVVDVHRQSAQGFFRTASRDRHLSPWSPVRLFVKAIIKFNLMPYFESSLLTVGRKC